MKIGVKHQGLYQRISFGAAPTIDFIGFFFCPRVVVSQTQLGFVSYPVKPAQITQARETVGVPTKCHGVGRGASQRFQHAAKERLRPDGTYLRSSLTPLARS